MEFLSLFLTFLKIGLFTIGGGYAMIPLIQDEVFSHNWFTQDQLTNFIAVSESTPGPFAINIATFVGMETFGLPGAFAATFGVVLPSFVIILIIAKFFLSFQENRFVKAALSGLRPAVVGLVIAAAVTIGYSIFFLKSPFASSDIVSFLLSGVDHKALILFVLLFGFTCWKKLSPIAIILISGGLGIIIYGLIPAF